MLLVGIFSSINFQISKNLLKEIFFNQLYVLPFRTLEPDQIQTACVYKPGGGDSDKAKPRRPAWRHEFNCGRKYQPSFNVAPSDIVPVLVSGHHFDYCEGSSEKGENSDDQRIIVPMMWGMIPFWFKGDDYRKHGLTTNNCRLESMLTSKLYKHSFDKGQRCILLCEGFYEWQTTDPKAKKASERAAYYIHMPQIDDIKIESQETWTDRLNDVNLLKIAGLFDVWKNPANGDQMYSFTVITFESDKTFSWLHHRYPAILETEQQVDDWLDFQRVTDTKKLVEMLKPARNLEWHQVSNIVNNARNKSEQCNKPLDEKLKVESPQKSLNASSCLMQAWLQKGKRKSESDLKPGDSDQKTKIFKTEAKSGDEKLKMIKSESDVENEKSGKCV